MSKLSKVAIIAISTILLVCFIQIGLFFHHRFVKLEEIDDRPTFTRLLRSALQQNKERPLLKLEEVTPFDWDKVYLFPPYTPHKIVTQALGNAVDPRGIRERDDISLLVFTKGEAIIHVAEVSTGFCAFKYPDCFPHTKVAFGIDRGAAVFRIRYRRLDFDWWEAILVWRDCSQ